jgi:hypothetical protein
VAHPGKKIAFGPGRGLCHVGLPLQFPGSFPYRGLQVPVGFFQQVIHFDKQAEQTADAPGENSGGENGENKNTETADVDNAITQVNAVDDINGRGNSHEGGADDDIAQRRSGEGDPKGFQQGSLSGSLPPDVDIPAEYIQYIVPKDIRNFSKGNGPPYVKDVIPKGVGKYSLDNGAEKAEPHKYPVEYFGFFKIEVFQKGRQHWYHHIKTYVFKPEGNIGIWDNHVDRIASHQKINSQKNGKETIIEVIPVPGAVYEKQKMIKGHKKIHRAEGYR